jgi:two-component system sensor histidine kinase KdpD
MERQYTRPDPDALLAKLKAESRGKLKIFLGYAPGVGKTYAMLEAAHQRKKDTDIVVAYVETHGRKETDALLDGLEVIPRKQVEYRGLTLTEMDLDSVLKRKPQLALVDELAHTNAYGSRNSKRYQDVEELLEAGIDVYSTLNIQHIESLRNSVAQITGVWVRETVPDKIIDNAAEIELVDLPPEELLIRLKEGKVYLTEQIAQATSEFFRKGNLTALRELTMRTGAEHIDEEVRSYISTHAIPGPWPTAERIMVCISPNYSSNQLVRTGRRLASQTNIEWFVIYVVTPNNVSLSAEQQERLSDTQRLAERLGAKVITIQGHSVVDSLIQFAKKNNITRILVGKRQTRDWRSVFRSSIVNQILRRSENIDVFIVNTTREPLKQVIEREKTNNWRGYLASLGLVIAATLLNQLTSQFLTAPNLLVIYLLCIVVIAYLWGLGPSIIATILSVLAFDFFFVPPFLTFAIDDTQYLISFAALLAVGIFISYLTSRIKLQTEAAMKREHQTATLYSLSRNLALTAGLDETSQVIFKSARETFDCDTVLFLPSSEDKEVLNSHKTNEIEINENDYAAALWTFKHHKITGVGTDTLPSSRARYLPLITSREAVGVLALFNLKKSGRLSIDQEQLLGAFADLAAVAIERVQFAELAHQAEIKQKVDELQTALLNSISHDLRTPLVSIIGTLSSLKDKEQRLDENTLKSLIEIASDEADRLDHIVTNLLDVSRIEAGAIKLSLQPVELQDLIGTTLGNMKISAEDRKRIRVDIAENLPFISADFGLITHVLSNVLDNALKYSPSDSPIDIKSYPDDKSLIIEVSDRGPGIAPQQQERIFDKFYRIQSPGNVTGTGLGLSICKGIVEAHGGSISAHSRNGGGTTIKIVLPANHSGKR